MIQALQLGCEEKWKPLTVACEFAKIIHFNPVFYKGNIFVFNRDCGWEFSEEGKLASSFSITSNNFNTVATSSWVYSN